MAGVSFLKKSLLLKAYIAFLLRGVNPSIDIMHTNIFTDFNNNIINNN